MPAPESTRREKRSIVRKGKVKRCSMAIQQRTRKMSVYHSRLQSKGPPMAKIKVLDQRLWSSVPQDIIAEAEAAAATQPCWIARQGNGHIVAMDGPGDPEVATGDVLFIAEVGPA
jgi:hypothetical protein